jgi:hypothetical protein
VVAADSSPRRKIHSGSIGSVVRHSTATNATAASTPIANRPSGNGVAQPVRPASTALLLSPI